MRWLSSCLLLLLSSFFTLVVGKTKVSEFNICAYNVEKFDFAKASNYRVKHTLVRILSRCDICLLQNVVDHDRKAIESLMGALNRATDRYHNYDYQALSSQSLGNSPQDRQQYVFIYRKQTVNVTGQHQYSKKQSFVREPFVVQFQSNKTAIKKFVLVPLHSEPNQAVQEVDRLYDVFKEVSKKWNNVNVMFLGDFHASCAYMSRADRKRIRLHTNKNFFWLIGDKVDTTVSEETSCAYDRIVVHGEPFLKAIKPYSAKVFDIAKEFKLSLSKVKEVSGHWPLRVTLKSSASLLQATPLLILLGVSVIVQSFLSALCSSG